MNNTFMAALRSEYLKVSHSKVPVITAVAFALAPIMGAVIRIINTGSSTLNSGLTVTNWPQYLGFLQQIIGVSGFIIFGIVVVWLFGREFTDRTSKDLLALPVSRITIICAKLAIALLWIALLVIIVVTIGLALGAMLNLSGWINSLALEALKTCLVVAGLNALLVTPLALVVSVTRSVLPATGVLFLLMMLAQIFGAMGFGSYFPWAVPGLLGASGAGALQPVGYFLVVFTGIIGTVATLAWWRYADQG